MLIAPRANLRFLHYGVSLPCGERVDNSGTPRSRSLRWTVDQGIDSLTQKTNRLLQVLNEQRAQVPAPVVWAGLELAAGINAWALELRHESMSHLHRQLIEIRRPTEPAAPAMVHPVAVTAEW